MLWVLFGADLNRTETLGKEVKLTPDEKLKNIIALFEELEEVIPSADYKHFKRIIDNKEENSYNKMLTGLELIKNNKK